MEGGLEKSIAEASLDGAVENREEDEKGSGKDGVLAAVTANGK